MKAAVMSEPVLLKVTGLVERPCELTWADLAALDPSEQIADVSRLAAGRPGTAVTLRGLISHVQPQREATHLGLHATRDDFHASIPLAPVLDRGVLIYALQGQPLSAAAGGPVRFYIPDFAACHTAEIDECANVKFVDHIELTAGPGHDNRPHDDDEHAALHEQNPS